MDQMGELYKLMQIVGVGFFFQELQLRFIILSLYRMLILIQAVLQAGLLMAHLRFPTITGLGQEAQNLQYMVPHQLYQLILHKPII